MILSNILPPFSGGIATLMAPMPFLATAVAEDSPIILSGVLLTLVVIYLASKFGAEVARRLDFPPVLGELVAGVIVGVSALHLVIFPEGGLSASDSVIMTALQGLNHLAPDALTRIFESQSEVISVLAEIGVIILLFEIGLERSGHSSYGCRLCRGRSTVCGGHGRVNDVLSCGSHSSNFWGGCVNGNEYRHYL
jgi:Sodium/hydrogen exchanger family